MSKSLREQLLALGLANPKPGKIRRPASKASGSTSKRCGSGNSTEKGQGGQTAAGEVPLDRAYALRQREEKKQTDTARKRKRAEDRRRRQLNQEIRAIVEPHRLNDAKAEIPRHFMYRGRIRKINLTPGQFRALNAGKLGIAYLAGGYHLLAPEHIEAVRKLSPEHIPDLASGETEEENECPIPDDLTW